MTAEIELEGIDYNELPDIDPDPDNTALMLLSEARAELVAGQNARKKAIQEITDVVESAASDPDASTLAAIANNDSVREAYEQVDDHFEQAGWLMNLAQAELDSADE